MQEVMLEGGREGREGEGEREGGRDEGNEAAHIGTDLLQDAGLQLHLLEECLNTCFQQGFLHDVVAVFQSIARAQRFL